MLIAGEYLALTGETLDGAEMVACLGCTMPFEVCNGDPVSVDGGTEWPTAAGDMMLMWWRVW